MNKQPYQFKLEAQDVAHVHTKHRTIKTPIPHPEDVKTFQQIMRFESSLITRQLPIVWDHAEGFNIYDRWGNKWIDLTSTIFVTNSGHANKRIKSNIMEVVGRGLLHAYCYPTVERANFLKKLIEITPEYLERASLVSTGTEASEQALKLARIYGMKFSPRKKVIIGGYGNFHGKTMGAMMAAVTPEAKEWIGNYDPDMHQLPFPFPWVLEEEGLTGAEMFKRDMGALLDNGVDPSRVAAFIIETYQGWGAIFYPKDYIKAMSDWAREHEALIIVDEIQSGFGRTGKLFGYQYYDIEPDLVCCGKGISGSLPLSAVLGRGELIELDATLTSTHGGHPVSSAAALGNLEALIEEDLINRAHNNGEQLKEWLEEWQNRFPDRIPRVLGKGMVWAVFICEPGTNKLDELLTDRLVERAIQKGVFIMRTGCGTVKFGPPLNIALDALKEAVDVLIESMEELIYG